MSLKSNQPLSPAMRWLIPSVALLVLLVFWEWQVQRHQAQGQVPLPSGIWKSGAGMIKSGLIFQAMAGSLKLVAIGYFVGALIGIPLGLAIGTVPALDRALRPVLDSLRSIAPIAWIPMALLWLGVQGNAALFVVAYAVIFPFVVNASQAARLVDRRLTAAARALGAGPWVMLRSVLIPSSLPMIFTGARIALAFAWASVIAAELAIGVKITGQGAIASGIGQLMVDTMYVRRDVDALVFYMLVVGGVSLLIDSGLRRLQARVLPWSPQ